MVEANKRVAALQQRRNNREFIPNFGERYHNGETISTAFVESTINQVVSKTLCQAAIDAVDRTGDSCGAKSG